MKLFALAAAFAAFLCAQVQLPISDLPPDTVVAKTSDGRSITAGEIRFLLEAGDPQSISMARNNPDLFLGSVFFNKYLAGEAEKEHLAEQSPLKEQLAFIINRFLAGAMVNRIREQYTVPEEAIAEFYKINQSRYEQAWIKVLAIGFCPTVATTGTTPEEIEKAARDAVGAAHCTSKRTEAQAHEIALGLVGRIRGGTDFVKLVAQYSDDPDSKATEGDFGLVTRDNSFKQEIKEATFALKEGEASNPIRSGNYFYIIKIKEKTVQPLSTVHEKIVQDLKQKHFTDWLEETNKRFKPVIERPDFFTGAKPPQ
jgi:hypothetical protein